MPGGDCQGTWDSLNCLVLVGLSNAYVSYIATPEEYEAQEYVGASTLWGPQEGPVLGCGLISLSEHTRPPRVCIPEQRFQPGAPPNKPFGVGFCGDRRQDPGEDLGDILLDDHGRPARLLPWFEWDETARGCRAHTLLGPTRNEFCDDFDAQSRRRVFIEEFNPSDGQWRPRQVSRTCVIEQPVTSDGKSVNDDDRGCNFVTTLMNGVSPPDRHWGSIWAARVLEDPPPHGHFRFRVHFRGGTSAGDVCSKGFDMPDQTGGIQVAPCTPFP